MHGCERVWVCVFVLLGSHSSQTRRHVSCAAHVPMDAVVRRHLWAIDRVAPGLPPIRGLMRPPLYFRASASSGAQNKRPSSHQVVLNHSSHTSPALATPARAAVAESAVRPAERAGRTFRQKHHAATPSRLAVASKTTSLPEQLYPPCHR